MLDNDRAGIDARKKIKEAQEQYKKKKFALVVRTLPPTEDIKKVNCKIKNSVYYEIEHLLSYEFWNRLKKWNWVVYKEKKDLIEVYNNVITLYKTLDAVIDEIVDDKNMKETVLYWNPKEDKKTQIVKNVIREVEAGNVSIIEGFKNTIIELEKELT